MQRPRPRSTDERILPLVNVVFLLLVFFMLAGRLAAIGPFPVDPPVSLSETTPGAGELVVLVGADGRVALDGEVVARRRLEEVVSGRLAVNPGLRVQLKGDADADANAVIEVMEGLRAAGASRLQLLTVTAP